MFLFIIGLIAALAAAGGLAVAVISTDYRFGGGATFVIGGIVAVLLIFLSMFTTVSTQNIGIETAFGKVTGHLSAGAHLKAPWASVTEMDGTIQTDTYNGKFCIPVRIAHQQTSCVNASIRWRIEPDAADQLFRNYHTFSAVRTSLVTRELEVALNEQFANYDPIESLVSTVPEGSPGNPTVIQVAVKVLAQMRADLHGQIHVLSVLIPSLTYDQSVQARINSVLSQVAQTDIALQAEKTATAQALANKALAASVSNAPGVLEANCLNLVSEAIKSNYALPAGFSCFGGSSVGVLAASGRK